MNSSSPNRCETRKTTLRTFNTVHLKMMGFQSRNLQAPRVPPFSGGPCETLGGFFEAVTDLIHPHLQNLEVWKSSDLHTFFESVESIRKEF